MPPSSSSTRGFCPVAHRREPVIEGIHPRRARLDGVHFGVNVSVLLIHRVEHPAGIGVVEALKALSAFLHLLLLEVGVLACDALRGPC